MLFGSWQDAVIAVVQWVFVIALLPTIFHPTDKPTLSTAALTAISLSSWHPRWHPIAAERRVGRLRRDRWTVLACQRYRINMRRGEPRSGSRNGWEKDSQSGNHPS